MEDKVVDTGTPAAPTPTPTPAPATAVDALRGAEARLSGGSPPPGDGTTPAGSTPPAATGTATPPAAPAATPAESEGIRNLRTQYEDLKSKTGWATGLNPQQTQEAVSFFREFMKNPLQFFRDLDQRLREDPEFKPHFEPQAEDLEPQADLVSEDGKHRVYSDKQLRKWREWNDRQTDKRVGERLSPLEARFKAADEAEAKRETQANAAKLTNQVMTEMRTHPYWPKKDEGEAAILKHLRAIPPHIRKDIGPVACLHRAFDTYLREAVYPTISDNAAKKVEEDMKRKAAAGAGGVRPGGGSGTGTVQRPQNVKDLAAHMEQLSRKTG